MLKYRLVYRLAYNGRGPEGCVEKWAGGCVARRLRIALDMRPPRALPAARFERNDVIIICETVH